MGDYTLTVVAIGYCTLPYSPLPEKEGDKKQLHGSGGCFPHIPDIPLVISICTENILFVVVGVPLYCLTVCSAWCY